MDLKVDFSTMSDEKLLAWIDESAYESLKCQSLYGDQSEEHLIEEYAVQIGMAELKRRKEEKEEK